MNTKNTKIKKEGRVKIMTEEQRDNLLLSMAESLKSMDTRIGKLENVQQEVLEKLEGQGIRIEKLENVQQEVLEKLEGQGVRIEKLENIQQEVLKELEGQGVSIKKVENIQQEILKEAERQRMNTARLEYNLTDQIRALFDVREINKDKFKEHDKILKSIDETLDSYNRRLLKLEKTN